LFSLSDKLQTAAPSSGGRCGGLAAMPGPSREDLERALALLEILASYKLE